MNRLLFIRHAETDLAGTFCGHSDPPVNARGKQQINDLIAQLQHERIDAIYSSDLLRAFTTAESVAHAFSIPVIARRALREIHFGEWEGLTWAEIERRDPIYAKRWMEEFPHLPAPRGESFIYFQARVLGELQQLVPLAQSSNIAVVTHRGVLRIILRELHGASDRQAFEQTSPYGCCFAFTSADETLKTAVPKGDRQ